MKGDVFKMSTIFGITEEKMKETSATFTLSEIYQQRQHGKRPVARSRSTRTSCRSLLIRSSNVRILM